MRERVLVSWSGGKDSALALYEILKDKNYQIPALLTTVTEGFARASMHGVREILLERQASSINLPLKKVLIPPHATNEQYESKMREALVEFKKGGISAVVFGDIFLEDIRRYREEKLSGLGIKGIFPLWRMDTAYLARRFIDLGFKAVVCCIDPRVLEPSFAGRIIDERFLADLPATVDPCGENGEFHSFVFDGPIFKERVSYTLGEVVMRDSFYFCDLVPG